MRCPSLVKAVLHMQQQMQQHMQHAAPDRPMRKKKRRMSSREGRLMINHLSYVCRTRALRGKDRAAPMDRPRAKKKVIRAPAVSASLGSTNLRREKGAEGQRPHHRKSQDSKNPAGSWWVHFTSLRPTISINLHEEADDPENKNPPR
ncbi:hypothetical protein INR49_027995, partial [Caranx melampygus]